MAWHSPVHVAGLGVVLQPLQAGLATTNGLQAHAWHLITGTKLHAVVCLLLQRHAAALGKFNEGVVSYDEEGEVELDLEKVDYASLMEVSKRHVVTSLR
jgi:hypothetical protein